MLKSNLGHLMVDYKINSISALSRLTGLSRETLTKIRSNKKIETIKLETFLKLCKHFNCSLDDLIEHTPNKD